MNVMDMLKGENPSEILKTEIDDTIQQLESLDKDTDEIVDELKDIKDELDDEDVDMFSIASRMGQLKEAKQELEDV